MSRPSRQEQHPPNRREFARTVAALAIAPLAAAGPVLAQEAKPSDPVAEVGQALGEAARALYGKFLTKDQLNAVKRRVAAAVRTGDRLRQVKLQNGDEPAFLFRADLP
jgi:hypothetical protein